MKNLNYTSNGTLTVYGNEAIKIDTVDDIDYYMITIKGVKRLEKFYSDFYKISYATNFGGSLLNKQSYMTACIDDNIVTLNHPTTLNGTAYADNMHNSSSFFISNISVKNKDK